MLDKIIALLPLRGGSKSIPLKNIKFIAGKPLCFWVLRAAVEASFFDAIYVSTDSIQIADVIKEFAFPKVELVERPVAYAQDASPTEEVMLHLMSLKNFDVLFTLQATSPLTTAHDLKEAAIFFRQGHYDSLLTGVLSKRFYWSLQSVPLNYDPLRRPRRQDFQGSVIENGAFYITKKKILEQYCNRLGGKIGIYIMPDDTLTEIDEPEDWQILDTLLRKRMKKRDDDTF